MSAPARRKRRIDWKSILGFAVSIFFLYIALRNVDAVQVLREIRGANPWWLLLAAATATGTIAVRAWRWMPILEPVLPRSAFRSRFAATFIRFAANNLIPARVGEFAGAYALSRMEPISASASFGSLVVERVLDALMVVGILFVSTELPGFPGGSLAGSDITHIARVVLAAVLAVTLALFLVVHWPRRALALVDSISARLLPESAHRRLVDSLQAFLEGVGSLRQPRLLFSAVVASLVVWLVSAFSFVFALLAFGIQVPLLPASLFLQSTIALAVAIPAAPGFFGVFEGAARFGLVQLWGVEVNKAVGFAIGMHLVGFIPVTLIGLYYFGRLGLSLREVEATEEIVERAVEVEAARHAGPGDG